MHLIVLPPPTPRRYVMQAFIYTLLAFVIVLGAAQFAVAATFFAPLYKILEFFFKPILSVCGVLREESSGYNGLLTVFLLVFLRAVAALVPATRVMLRSLDEFDRTIGPIKTPVHKRWLWGMGALWLLSSLAQLWPPLALTDFRISVFVDAVRIVFVIGGGVGGFALMLVAMQLRRSWLQGGAAPLSPPMPTARSGKKRSRPALRLIKNEAPKVASSAELSAVLVPQKPRPVIDPLCLALAAELVQACGRTGAAPTVEALTQTLTMLQTAARLTHSGNGTWSDLGALSHRALDLFAAGQLTSLPDINAAKQLYARKGQGLLDPLAEELATKLQVN